MNNKKTVAIKAFAALLAFLILALNYGGTMSAVRELPDAYYAESMAELNAALDMQTRSLDGVLAASASGDETLSEKGITYRLYGFIPVKTATAHIGERIYLNPGGQAVGISIHTNGVLVVGITTFDDINGIKCSPAGEAGILAGDVILSVSGQGVSSSEELGMEINRCRGAVTLEIERSGERRSITVLPRQAEDGSQRIGAWVRDSTIGVGTLSYFDAQNSLIAALGHAIVDADTGSLLVVRDGTLVNADIVGVSRGIGGIPGELHGVFDDDSVPIGTIVGNTELGIYGYASKEFYAISEALPVAFPDEVCIGDAYILTTVDDCGVQPFACRIVSSLMQDEPAPKGLVIEITDSRLLELTGGIVQGMSGSPIIQNGRLVGVITHVFVNDPTKGYGAYAYWMYKTFG